MIIVKNAELFEKTNVEENELCFNPESKDLDVSNLNTSNMTNMGYMFSDCKSLTELDLSKWDTSNVINMNDMFSGCYALKTVDVSKFDTSNVTDMSNMFADCYELTALDISNWDTSKVTDMSYMFYNCRSLTTIKGVIDMKSCILYDHMFDGCDNLIGVKIKNPPADFEIKCGIRKDQYEIVD